MIKWMVLGGPRSATTWAANWLTTESTMCLHDPLIEYRLRQLDVMTIPGKEIGIACTSTLLFPEWYLKHPAKKILLYREPQECNRALEALGLPPIDIPAHNARMLSAERAGIPLWHWESLFEEHSARQIWKHLMPGVEFDSYRHNLLAQFNVQPHWRRLPVGKDAVQDLIKRAHEVTV